MDHHQQLERFRIHTGYPMDPHYYWEVYWGRYVVPGESGLQWREILIPDFHVD